MQGSEPHRSAIDGENEIEAPLVRSNLCRAGYLLGRDARDPIGSLSIDITNICLLQLRNRLYRSIRRDHINNVAFMQLKLHDICQCVITTFTGTISALS